MKIVSGQDLRLVTTMKIPAVARFFVTASTEEELAESIAYAKKQSLPYVVVGGGSNIAFVTNRYDGLVIRNMSRRLVVSPGDGTTSDVTVSSGYPMSAFVAYLIEHGFEGMEYQTGLPGTVGGAVYMNSKWTKPLSYVGDYLVSAELIGLDGTRRTESKDYFHFAYDYSILHQTHEVLLNGTFRFKHADPDILRERARSTQEHRKHTQPQGVFTSGCFFRNLSEEEKIRYRTDTVSAGRLIDTAGLKNTRIGSFVVSPVHANFIVHEGGGKPEDLKRLLALVKQTVKKVHNVDLHEEVCVIDN